MSAPVAGAPNLTVIDAVTQFVGGTEGVWNDIAIPVPSGLVVYAVDTKAVKIGDGSTLYANLPTLFTLTAILDLVAQMTALSGELSNTPTTATVTAAISAAIIAAFAGSPEFGGAPTLAAAPSPGDNSLRIPTTAFVVNALATLSLEALGGITPEALASDITAALNNANLTGAPTAPTPAFNSNNTDIATAAFVVQAGGNFAGITSLTVNATLTAANIGQLLVDNTIGAPSVFTLPALSTVRNGGALSFMTNNPNGCEIVTAGPGPDQIAIGGIGGGAVTTVLNLMAGDTLTLVGGTSYWNIAQGTVQLQNTNRIRNRLTANIVLHVDASAGSDTTGTGNINYPFASPTAAYDYALANFDLAGQYQVMFQIAAGNYGSTSITGSLVGQSNAYQVVFNGAGATTILGASAPTQSTFYVSEYASVVLQNVKIVNANHNTGLFTQSGWGIVAGPFGTILLGGGITLGTCGLNQVTASPHGFISQTSNSNAYFITGNAQSFLFADSQGYIGFSGASITISNAVTYSQTVNSNGRVDLTGVVWHNPTNVTGVKFSIYYGGFIWTNGAGLSFIPGSVAGTIATITFGTITSLSGSYY